MIRSTGWRCCKVSIDLCTVQVPHALEGRAQWFARRVKSPGRLRVRLQECCLWRAPTFSLCERTIVEPRARRSTGRPTEQNVRGLEQSAASSGDPLTCDAVSPNCRAVSTRSARRRVPGSRSAMRDSGRSPPANPSRICRLRRERHERCATRDWGEVWSIGRRPRECATHT
jgi:hypothetical protein